MKIIGPSLFFLGILVAISGSAKLPAAGATYPDTAAIFVAGMILAIVGTVLWRKTVAQMANEELDPNKDTDALQLLRELSAPAQDLRHAITELTPDKICENVDLLLESYVLPFAENRQQVLNRLGMNTGAELLVTMAYGERMLNRTWSAAADGYPHEALAVYPDAVDAFQEALAILQRAEEAAR